MTDQPELLPCPLKWIEHDRLHPLPDNCLVRVQGGNFIEVCMDTNGERPAAVTVKPLEWERGERDQVRAFTLLGEVVCTRFGGVWHHAGEPFDDLADAQDAAEYNYQTGILSALSPQPSPQVTPEQVALKVEADHEILSHTFAVQHNPNCPSAWLVRLPGMSSCIDLKPYSHITPSDEVTGDILGFGKTFEEAADAALRAIAGGDE